MDNEHTKKFFRGSYKDDEDDAGRFQDYLHEFIEIGKHANSEINKKIDKSELSEENCFLRYPTKIIDNAIMEWVDGYMPKHHRKVLLVPKSELTKEDVNIIGHKIKRNIRGRIDAKRHASRN